ncbi:hypothetical protein MHM98_12110 [Psychrobium sp. MM17-31]|uniref:hypothetical protein n=1 Tax=Psychrobium sp. MM17-31 TaxID=2917758 RepID=UPI001EF42B4A|nr:hypothetical protein [Psychrobium sp. MM17-31]MCG7532079.1 hypothetical protein [Psychrobium sp. MM17-31]
MSDDNIPTKPSVLEPSLDGDDWLNNIIGHSIDNPLIAYSMEHEYQYIDDVYPHDRIVQQRLIERDGKFFDEFVLENTDGLSGKVTQHSLFFDINAFYQP